MGTASPSLARREDLGSAAAWHNCLGAATGMDALSNSGRRRDQWSCVPRHASGDDRTASEAVSGTCRLFAGWITPPMNPDDPADPVSPNAVFADTGGPFNADMASAVQRIEGSPGTFDGDDAIGVFIETTWRPFPNVPRRRAPDRASGIHNYLHGRFTGASEDLDMGNPEVNIHNQRFWRLHGWIERNWSIYRTVRCFRNRLMVGCPRVRSTRLDEAFTGCHVSPTQKMASDVTTTVSGRARPG